MRRKSDLIILAQKLTKRSFNFFLHCLTPLLFIIFIFLFSHAPATAAPIAGPNCGGSQYNPNSSFAVNLKTLFSSLTNLSSTTNSANDTAGAGDSIAYGLYMCQGDLPGSECQECILDAIPDINESCSGRSRGVVWYDLCELRYSDDDFFGDPVTDGHNLTNPKEKTSSNMPYQVMSELVQVAPLQKPLMFATNASHMYPIFAMAQCSADLSRDGCRTCLNASLAFIKGCCTQAKGWRFLTPTCWIRYESTPISGDPNIGYTEIIRSNCSTDGLSSNNLISLLSDLKSNAPSTGFYNASAGASGSEVYGLALCRKDPAQLPSSDCTDCISTAGSAIANECPNKTEGIMWYDSCFLRYSNQNFFGVVDGKGQAFCSQADVSAETDNITVTKAESLVQEAVKRSSLFAAGKAEISDSDSSFVMVQCTRDLTSDSCRNCLEGGMQTIIGNCKEKRGWQYLSGSCAIRYEVFSFFNGTAATTTPPPPEGQPSQGGKSKTSKLKIVAIVLPIVGVVLLGLLFYCGWKRLRRGGRKLKKDDFKTLQDRDVTYIDLAIIQAATNNFSDENMLGKGGFGPVYKGVLPDGKEIAVKRLSEKSKQGSSEFKNEVKLIAKLQHKNLVRMLGCCVQGEEKLLIYEYLPNKSLDSFLFDPNKRVQLDWERRFLIISGIAKGLLYLHEDSLLKVIHRDLKASNVLLDKEMNPKISDFGMAKIYMPDESEVNTNRIVGTFGYMAPEYAMDGIFSVKSDVYSFGVLVIEIICGTRNGRAHLEQHGQNLLRRAWDLWNEGKASEIIDPLLENRYSSEEAMRCINIGLLCVQENPEERPTMSAVVLMLRTDAMVIPQPGQPPNFIKRRNFESDESLQTSSTAPSALQSINEVTDTGIVPR